MENVAEHLLKFCLCPVYVKSMSRRPGTRRPGTKTMHRHDDDTLTMTHCIGFIPVGKRPKKEKEKDILYDALCYGEE